MMRLRTSRRAAHSDGFTMFELLLALTLGLIAVSAAYAIMAVTSRAYAGQRETTQARSSLRAIGSIFLSELAGASASGGDLYTLQSDSLVIRSIRGSGIICGWDATNNKLGLQEVSGAFGASADDSVLVYLPSTGDYATKRVQQAWNDPSAAQSAVSVCFWGDSSTSVPRPEAAVMVPSAAGFEVGSLVYAFRKTTYGLFQSQGEWWLGQRIGSGTAEPLVGPMEAPQDGGLTLSYFDSSGNVTTDPADVHRVSVTLRSRGFGVRPTLFGGAGQAAVDSLTLQTFLRNGE